MKNFPGYQDLTKASAALGGDPLLLQAAGGNTSIKTGETMWIKASGKWLRDAEDQDIFVPLDLSALQDALQNSDARCESCIDFVRHELNPMQLRPSIETSVHGLMKQKVVLHVHCVNAIALAIRDDAEAQLKQRLLPFKWVFVPYARPGLQLANAIRSAQKCDTNVLILQNHGLAVAADTVDEATVLLRQVSAALAVPLRRVIHPNLGKLAAIAHGTAYVLPKSNRCHGFAMEKWSHNLATQNVYYPDHAVFLGTRIPAEFGGNAPAIAFPGAGVLVRNDAAPSVEPMLGCLSDIFRRLNSTVKLRALPPDDVAQLMNWDAEKYRQSLEP